VDVGKLLPTILETKYENILAQENTVAKAVARSVIGQNPVTAWDVLIPIVFVFNMLKFKRAREIFALNFLFTKKLALQGAFDMIKTGQSREDALAQIRNRTSEILASDKKGIYSIKIRQKQMREVELLLDHYHRLLNADGKDYSSMVRNAYSTRKDFAAFVNQLEGIEKEVNRAAIQTVKTASAPDIILKMEEATTRVRAAEAENIFPSTNE
jgi:plasmid maintenance system killer protein